MSLIYNSLLFYFWILLTFGGQSLAAKEPINLQLRWDNSFQFAGFYMAKEQNLYSQNGLNVTIKSAFNAHSELVSPIQEVISGRADFGVDNLHLLSAIDTDAQLVILAPIMQHSPAALVTLPGHAIKKAHDLIGKKIRVVRKDELINELLVILSQQKIRKTDIKIDVGPATINSLVKGEVDVLLTYGASVEFSAQQLQQPIELTYLKDLGSEFYGDVLFTHQSVIDKHPEIVADFLAASLAGWRYAVTHVPETVFLISALSNQQVAADDRLLFNHFYAKAMIDYMQWPEFTVAVSDQQRWYRIYNQLHNSGLLKREFNIDDYLYRAQLPFQKWSRFLLVIVVALILLVVILQFSLLQEYRHVFIIGTVLLLTLYTLLEQNIRQKHIQQLKFDALGVAQKINASLANQINRNVILLKNLAAFIAVNPNLSPQQFQSYCAEIFDQGAALINLAAAPDLVIKMIYPLVGNETTLEVDYREIDAQSENVLRAAKQDKTLISNPIQLIQGGRAVIIRQGVFPTGSNQSWGIVSAVIDLDLLFQSTGVWDFDNRFRLIIDSHNGDSEPFIIFGNSYFRQLYEPIVLKMELIDQTWDIYITPKQGWDFGFARLWLYRLLLAVIILFWFFRVHSLLQRKQQRYQTQQKLKEHETLLHEVVTVAKMAAWRVNEQGDILQWTAKSKDVLGQSFPANLKHVDEFWDFFPEEYTQAFKADVIKASLSGKGFDIEIPYRDEDDKIHWLRMVSDQTLETENGMEIIGVLQDITDYKEINELIQYQATHDNLTGLLNRSAFSHQIEQSLQLAGKNHLMAALIFIDLDNFKNINDSLGHAVGDEVLIRFARIIEQHLDEKDTLARYSGDEFVILTVNTAYSVLKNKTELLLNQLTQPIDIQGRHLFVSASLGVAVFPDHADNADDLVAKADLAMYAAKDRGKSNYCFYNAEMQADAQLQMQLKHDIKQAINDQNIQVYYQPIVQLSSGKVVKIEALMRCFNPAGGFYNTEKLIEVSEQSNLIVEVDIAVLRQIIIDIKRINAGINETIEISINVSAHIFKCQSQLFNEWRDLLYQVAEITAVTLEITERSLLDKSNQTMDAIVALTRKGIHIAIDDFGVGFSSLSVLMDYPVSILKIDRSFVSFLGTTHNKHKQIINAIIKLSKTLNYTVIAEGVETAEQSQLLIDYDCDLQQGYLFSEAVAVDKLIAVVNGPQFKLDKG